MGYPCLLSLIGVLSLPPVSGGVSRSIRYSSGPKCIPVSWILEAARKDTYTSWSSRITIATRTLLGLHLMRHCTGGIVDLRLDSLR